MAQPDRRLSGLGLGHPAQPGVVYRGLRTVAVDDTCLHEPDDPAPSWRCRRRKKTRCEPAALKRLHGHIDAMFQANPQITIAASLGTPRRPACHYRRLPHPPLLRTNREAGK